MENLPKKGPLFREFGAQKPTHMGGTYPYPQHVMYPPPRGIHVPARVTGQFVVICPGYGSCFVNLALVMGLLYGDLPQLYRR